jgi:hypothetical protein
MEKFLIIFNSLTNPETGDKLLEASSIAADTQSEAISEFYQQMVGTSFEIIDVMQQSPGVVYGPIN